MKKSPIWVTLQYSGNYQPGDENSAPVPIRKYNILTPDLYFLNEQICLLLLTSETNPACSNADLPNVCKELWYLFHMWAQQSTILVESFSNYTKWILKHYQVLVGGISCVLE